MNNNTDINKVFDLSKIGNFTKNAVKSFENGIVNETNFLEKSHSNINKKK